MTASATGMRIGDAGGNANMRSIVLRIICTVFLLDLDYPGPESGNCRYYLVDPQALSGVTASIVQSDAAGSAKSAGIAAAPACWVV